VYADSTAVLGPLAAYSEPHSYDLCVEHSTRLTAPRGWAVLRLAEPDPGPVSPSSDDLEALANAVRQAAHRPRDARDASTSDRHGPDATPVRRTPTDTFDPTIPGGRRSHLRALPNPDR
jgi:hypothetical protein